MSVEEHLADWAAQMPGLRVLPAELEFIAAMRRARSEGVGYGWMQQVIEWEWQANGHLAFGPERSAELLRDLVDARIRIAELEKILNLIVLDARDQGRDECFDDLVDEQFIEKARALLRAVPQSSEEPK